MNRLEGPPKGQPDVNTFGLATNPFFMRMNLRNQWFAQNTADYLTRSSQLGLIDLSRSRRIIHFGASEGAETVTLSQLARSNRGSVTALELDHEAGGRLLSSGILPPEQVYIGDGIKFFSDMQRVGAQADLIAIPFLDNYGAEALVRRLIPAAKSALAPHGKLLITSDRDTMMITRGVFDDLGIQYTTFTAGNSDLVTRSDNDPQLRTFSSPSLFPQKWVSISSDPELEGKSGFFRHSGLVTSLEEKITT